MCKSNKKRLGVIGGLGPMSSAYFYQLLTEKTRVTCDQDHLDLVLSSRATTPDRTDFILGRSQEDPLPVMIGEAEKLVAFGAQVLALTCNTAHFFYERLQQAIPVPILNIGALAVERLKQSQAQKIGLLATSGTVQCGIYQSACAERDITCVVPDAKGQAGVMEIIYGQIKAGMQPDLDSFFALANQLKEQGADRIILGCTELSLIGRETCLDSSFLDPLVVLAEACITACGHEIAL